MQRFQFSLSNTQNEVREAGIVKSGSFQEALATLDEHIDASEGDTLEVGVPGFPPARYEYVFADLQIGLQWRPARRDTPQLIAAVPRMAA